MQDHPRVGAAEVACINVWGFYLYWVPKFLNSQYRLTLDRIGLPLVVIYLAADVGCIGGGWFSSLLIGRGWLPVRAPKGAMLISALLVSPRVFAVHVSDLWTAVAMISVATSAHQGCSANRYTLVSDMYLQRVVGSMVGVVGQFEFWVFGFRLP